MPEIAFGNVKLPVNEKETPFIPALLPYKEHGKILETIAFGVSENMPVLLIGETGVGKTAGVRYIAAKTKNSLRRVNVNGSMTAEDFLGQNLARATATGAETYWKDGVLTECMREGYWIVIDEINAASPEVLFALHSLLDDDRYIVLTDHPQREIVHAHPDFRIFATMNPPERYTGTQVMNKALLSRFPLTISVPIPPPRIEYGELSGASKVLKKGKTEKLHLFVEELRTAYQKEELDVFISPRDIAHIVRVHAYTKDLRRAIELTVAGRGTKAEQKAIMDMATLHFGKTEDEEEGEKKVTEPDGQEVELT